MAGRFEGKQALVLGVANRRSIAWAIARRLAEEGAQVAFTYQGERIEKSVRDLAATVESPLVTEWPAYLELAWGKLAPTMRRPIVLDGRYALDPHRLAAAGLRYLAPAGWNPSGPALPEA